MNFHSWPCQFAITLTVLVVFLSSALGEDGYEDLVKKTEAVRGLSFKTPVPFERLSKEQLSMLLARELARQYQPEDWRNIRDSFALLGAAPKDLDLEKFYSGLLAEQVGGLYDPHSKKMQVVGDLSLKVALTQIILEHELTHALTDQHFDLLKLPFEMKDNDDRALAALALVEGDATLSMLLYAKDLGLANLLVTAAASLFMDQDTLSAAPPLFQGMLLFPYLAGENFLLELAANHDIRDGTVVNSKEVINPVDFGDWDLVNHVYQHPPQSTEQILHPEKLYKEPDPPVDVILGEAEILRRLGEGWNIAWHNTAGEFIIRTLLLDHMSSHATEKAAAGWGGDRYCLVRSGSGETAFFWKTIWDTEEDADEFRAALEKAAAAGMFGGTPVLLPPTSQGPGREVSLWIVSNPSDTELVSQETEP